MDYFSIEAQIKTLYSSYTPAICQQLQISFLSLSNVYVVIAVFEYIFKYRVWRWPT